MTVHEPQSFHMGCVKCSTHTIQEFLQEIQILLADPSIQPRTLNFINAHVYNLAASDPLLRENLNASRIVSADGMSIVWAARLFGAKLAERCNMTEAFRAFLADNTMPHSRAILIGCRQEEAKLAATNIAKASDHCSIAHTISGYASDAQYKQILSRHRDINLILIGMSSPKSEKMVKMSSEINPDALVWHIGAGTILFFSGCVKEAPAWMRKTGLQWVHRLFIEPQRMWKRYLLGNPRFIKLIFFESKKNAMR